LLNKSDIFDRTTIGKRIMAIINCPKCDKKTTEISSRCPHCGYERGVEGDDRQTELKRRAIRDQVYHLKMTSYVVITVFLAAFGWYWWDTEGFQYRSSMGPVIVLALAAMAYLAIRFLLFRAAKNLKKFRRSL
jgi:hypothetical protein